MKLCCVQLLGLQPVCSNTAYLNHIPRQLDDVGNLDAFVALASHGTRATNAVLQYRNVRLKTARALAGCAPDRNAQENFHAALILTCRTILYFVSIGH
jgi:hypothetical protein